METILAANSLSKFSIDAKVSVLYQAGAEAQIKTIILFNHSKLKRYINRNHSKSQINILIKITVNNALILTIFGLKYIQIDSKINGTVIFHNNWKKLTHIIGIFILNRFNNKAMINAHIGGE